MALSAKHQQFVNEYLKCWNATKAYQVVYPSATYETANKNASALMVNHGIAEAIQQRIDENAMSANEVLQRLAEHGRGTLQDFVKVNENGWDIDLHKAQQLEKLHLLKKISRTEKTFRVKDKEETTVVTTIELHDVQNALNLLGKNLGIFSDSVKLVNELERALDVLQDKLDDSTYKAVLSALSSSGFSGASAAKNREETSGSQE